MEYITYFTFITFSAILNRTRGQNDISRTTFTVSNFLLSYICFKDVYFAAICSIGILIWLTRGWGKYFMAHNGSLEIYKEDEVDFVDYLSDKIVGVPTNYSSARNWGTVAMALRGSLFAIPLFTAIGIYLENYWFSLLAIPMMLMGLIYRKVDDDHKKPTKIKRWYDFGHAERITGILYGTLITITILLSNG